MAAPVLSLLLALFVCICPKAADGDPVDLFLSQSAFIGNSVGEGLTMYNNAKGKEPLGDATMLTRVSYSFYADRSRSTRFMPVYAGTPMQAKDAIKQCGVKYVFICMGTNDLVGSAGASSAYEQYLEYIAGILGENPGITIFIESCTPTRPGSNVNNEKVTEFNGMMKAYCDATPGFYYVDIATPLMDATGYLDASLSSDGSVHLTNKAYAIWADTVRSYIAWYMTARLEAMRQQHMVELEVAEANYNKAMNVMEEKKLEKRNVRVKAEREAAEAQKAIEDEIKRYRLLNVPDEVTIMHSAVASVTESQSEPACMPQRPEEYLTSKSLGRL